jgi:hypothetical protein
MRITTPYCVLLLLRRWWGHNAQLTTCMPADSLALHAGMPVCRPHITAPCCHNGRITVCMSAAPADALSHRDIMQSTAPATLNPGVLFLSKGAQSVQQHTL